MHTNPLNLAFSFLLLTFLFGVPTSEAAEVLRGKQAESLVPGAEVVRLDEGQVPSYIAFKKAEGPATEAWQEWIGQQFFQDGNAPGFEFVSEESDRFGMTHTRYTQTIGEASVALGWWIVHSQDGQVLSMNGNLIKGIEKNTPVLSEDEALSIALSMTGASRYAWESPEEEAALKHLHDDPQATYTPKGSLAYISPDLRDAAADQRLAWMFNIYALEPLSRHEVYIDALDGSLLFKHNLIQHADSNGVAHTGYSGQRSIVSDYTGSQFRLRETGRGNGVQTFDMNNGTSGLGSDFFHPDNVWDTNTVERFGTDAHWGAEMTYDYFYNHFNRNSINNNGFTLISRVHYGTNYANAFWNGSFMTYGDGSSGNSPFTALDIAGHEIAHGLTSFTAGLIYQNESGALNESFSDIFGAAIEFEALGFSNGDWLIGEDLGFIIRSMSNPNSQGDPDTYHGNDWYFGTGDNGGVHTNSGVQNFWFYLLTVGGTGTNDLGNAYSVQGIGVDDAAAIAYRNLVTYLGPSSDYDDARFYAIQSAYDLFGPCSQQVTSTANAWFSVGLGTPFEQDVTADFIPNSTGNCAVPHAVSFVNTSSHATTQSWTFGDGASSSQYSPTHTYTSAGTYTVQLIVSSSCGADTLTMPDLIEIGPQAPCEVFMPANGQSALYEECAGTIFDQGGATENYDNNTDSYVSLKAQGAASITLYFDQFSVEPGGGANCIYDYVEVYDGLSVFDSVIGRFCNSNPPPASLTSTGDEVTVRFVTNQGFTFPGFKIDWACNAPTTPPDAQFEASVTKTCDGAVQFFDRSQLGADAWFWDFGDGTTDTVQHPVHTYTQSGLYDITLIAGNSLGTDTITEHNHITVHLSEKPEGEDAEICPGEQAVLTVSSVGRHRWYLSPTGNFLLHEGDTFITPVVQQSTAYYVESVVESSPLPLGPTSNQIGAGGYIASPYAMHFDALSEMVLESVKVFANSGGTRTFELRDQQGNLLADTSISFPSGVHEVSLEFHVAPGTDYRLGVSGNTTINMYRNTEGASYPYELDGVARITKSGGNAPQSEYFYFYDWKVREVCISERLQIAASTGLCTGVKEGILRQIKVYPNPTDGYLHIDGALNGVSLSLHDMNGRLISLPFHEVAGVAVLNLQHLASGVYTLRIQNDMETRVERVIVH